MSYVHVSWYQLTIAHDVASETTATPPVSTLLAFLNNLFGNS